MTLTILSFLFFTGFVGVVVIVMTRKDDMSNPDAYFLGGRQLTAWVIAGSLILTNLSTEHLIGLNGDAFRHTIAVMAWETTAALAMVLTALFFLPRYLKRGLTTIPDFLAERFDQQTATIATALFLFSYVIAILPVVLLFGATGIESLFDVSTTLGISRSASMWLIVWGVGTIGSLYAIFGGLRAVALSDTINGIGFLGIGLLIPALGLMAIGDGDLIAGWNQLFTEEEPKFDITGNEPGSFLPFSVLFTGMIVNQIFFWCANQSIMQRALSAKNLKEGQKGVLLAAFFKLLGPLIIVLPGVIAFHMFKNELAPEQSLLAYPTLVKEVLPSPLQGLFAAVMIGAVLSTFNSVLNSSATLFSKNIYAAFVHKSASPKQVVRSGRVCSIVLAIGAMFIAPMIDTSGSVYNYLQTINATFFGPMLAVILMGYLTTRTSAIAAKVALIVGPALFYILVFAYGEPVQETLKSVFSLEYDVHFLHFLAFVFLATVIMQWVISVVAPNRKSYSSAHTHDVDITPWRFAKPVSALIVVATIAFYVALAQ